MRGIGTAVVLAGVLLGSLAQTALAGGEEGTIVSAPEYLEYLGELRAALEEDKPKPLSQTEWRNFDRADASIRRLLQGRESVMELPVDERVQLHNAQEQIVSILSGNEDERVICRRQSSVGTHFRQTECVTASQRRQERDASMEMVRRMPPVRIAE